MKSVGEFIRRFFFAVKWHYPHFSSHHAAAGD